MAINRVQVIWSGTLIAGGGLTNFYFDDATGTPAQQVAAVETFLDDTEASRSSTVSWATDPDVATLNVGTGTIEAITSVTAASGVGTASGDALSPATQGLLRIYTGTIVGGRLLRGRIFLPGAVESVNNATGGPMSAIAVDYNTAGAALVSDANTAWMCWSRTHSTAASVATVDFWAKWAVLRSRRD